MRARFTGTLAVVLGMLVFVTGVVGAQGRRPERRSGRATRAHLNVNPVRYTGFCPAHLRFTGTITADGPAVVRYTFQSFDGGSRPERSLRFEGPGTKSVGEVWTMGAPGGKQHRLERIRVLSPDTLESKSANFEVQCRPHR
jgi:hypothetical protein